MVLAVEIAAPVGAQVLAAAKDRDTEGVRRALQLKPPDVNAAEADGTTALHWASYHDNG